MVASAVALRVEGVQKRWRGDQELMTELIEIYCQNLPERLEAIRNAAAARDLVSLSKAAHALKSATGTIGAQAAYDALASLEVSARTGDATASESAVTAVLSAVDQFARELNAYVNASDESLCSTELQPALV